MQEFWINKTIEECSEVIQALCKWRNYGPELKHPLTGVSNKDLLEEEIGDLEYCLEQLKETLNLDGEKIIDHYCDKRNKIETYLPYSRLVEQDEDIKQSMRLQKIND